MKKLIGLIRTFFLIVGMLFSIAAFAARGASHDGANASANAIRIGQIAALTGPVAMFGIPERDAVEYMVEKANKGGGIHGHKIAFFVEDGQANPTEIAKAARKLIFEDKVDVIIGPTTGSGALAIGPIIARHHVPMLSPVGTIAVTEKDSGFYDWVFRSTPNNRQQTKMAFDYINGKHYKRVGLFYQRDAYGEQGATYLKKLSGAVKDIKIVSEASAELNAANVSVQVTKILAANPDVIVLQASSPTLGAAFLRAAHSRGSSIPIVVSPGLAMPAFIKISGVAAEGIVTPAAVGWDKPTHEQAQFIKNYGQPKNFGEAISGTAFLIIEHAVGNIDGEINGQVLRKAIENLCPFPTLQGAPGCYSPADHDGGMHGREAKVIDGKWVTITGKQ